MCGKVTIYRSSVPVKHVVVTRFSVPLPQEGSRTHANAGWLSERLELLRAYYVPSLELSGVRAVLLCSRDTAGSVMREVSDLGWVTVEEQDDWYGGWEGGTDEVLTRLDSDDAVAPGWFNAIDAYSPEAATYCCRGTYMLDAEARRLYEVIRPFPAALAARAAGKNPYAVDHRALLDTFGGVTLPGKPLLQVVHGGNVLNRIPTTAREVPLGAIAEFGLSP